jgi:hypothetical protein
VALWPKLRTLALYNPGVSAAQFWPCLGRLGHLETLVLTRSDGLESVDMKGEWREHCGDKERRLRVVLVNMECEHRVPMVREGWRKEDEVIVREANVPVSYYGDDDDRELCREWVKQRMLRGEAGVCLT